MDNKGTHSYQKIYHLGSAEVEGILDDVVWVTEKIDGSQIGFGVIDGELVVRSKGQRLNLDNPNAMFAGAVAYLKTVVDKLDPKLFYYGECLQKPRHNKLTYKRIPEHHIALYDVLYKETDSYYFYDMVEDCADLLCIDAVPLLKKEGRYTLEELKELLERDSYLGGEMEGIVIMSDSTFPAKLVRTEFQEKMRRPDKVLKESKDIEKDIDEFFETFRTVPRWEKAIQHLREDGLLKRGSEDIGVIIKEIQRDVLEEEENYIKENLWNIYRRRFLRSVIDGFPTWYQQKLISEVQNGSTDD